MTTLKFFESLVSNEKPHDLVVRIKPNGYTCGQYPFTEEVFEAFKERELLEVIPTPKCLADFDGQLTIYISSI